MTSQLSVRRTHPTKHARSSHASTSKNVIRELGRVLRTDQHLWFLRLPVRLAFDAGELGVEGSVPSLAIKRQLLQLAGTHPAVTRLTDRLHVAPAALMSDAELRDQVVDALVEDGAFADCGIHKHVRGGVATVQRGGTGRGQITVRASDGVVTLEGEVATRMDRRLAGVLAWWVPGTADVKSWLRTTSNDPVHHDDIAMAVRSVLAKDPNVDAEQIRVEARSGVVTLTGLVWSAAEREQAANDAWYVLGVSDVVNALRVATHA